MHEDIIHEELVHPDFETINELQIFDASFDLSCPFRDLGDMSVSFN